MGWLERMKLDGAAKRYARRLPRALREGWGGAKTYTPAQIRKAIDTAGLDPAYAVFGYAAFLPEEDFALAVAGLPIQAPYAEARERLLRFLPGGASAFDPPPMNEYTKFPGPGS